MPASPLSSGPVHIWVGVRVTVPARTNFSGDVSESTTGGNAVGAATVLNASVTQYVTKFRTKYLGTGEVAPTRRIRRHYAPLMNDLAGPAVPFDKIRAGQDALVSVTLTRWDPVIYRAIAGMSAFNVLPGIETAADRGSLMIREGLAYPLYLRYPFFDSHPAMQASGMVPGYRFYAAMLEGDDDEEPGTRANKDHLVWYCGGVHNPTTGAFGLYDYNVLDIPAIPPAI